jgi:hypothetical protein
MMIVLHRLLLLRTILLFSLFAAGGTQRVDNRTTPPLPTGDYDFIIAGAGKKNNTLNEIHLKYNCNLSVSLLFIVVLFFTY